MINTINRGQLSKNQSLAKYRLLLTAAAAVWGFGFPIGKTAIAVVGATWFTALRFLGAGIVLTLLLYNHLRKHFNHDVLRAGAIIGVFSFAGFWTQFLGLGWTTPSKNAFLSACYCVTVPFIWWVIKRVRPSKRIVTSAVLCVVGIGFVSLTEGFSIDAGDTVSIISAFVYGAEIVVISLTMQDHDVMTVTVVQQYTSGLLALIFAIVTQPVPTAAEVINSTFLGCMAYVIIGSAAFGAIAQNIAQTKLSASESGLLCSLESVFCAVFSVTLFGEVLTPHMVIGFVLIFCSLVIAQVEPQHTRRLIEQVKRPNKEH